MAFRDFTFPAVGDVLGLSLADSRLFPVVTPYPVAERFAAFLRGGAELAAAVNTEKARSEFIIAPILLELRLASGNRFNVFSGVDWEVDRERGLNGYCDFLLTHGPSQHFIAAPFAVVIEAKNEQIPAGMGQCIAAMYAAEIVNRKAGAPAGSVYGAVTTGGVWKFLRLTGADVAIDAIEYFIDDLATILGILDLITRRPAALAAA